MSKINNYPFKVPSEYFGRLEDEVLSKLNHRDKPTNAFRVPTNYFTRMEESVLNKINRLPRQKKKYRRFYLAAYAAVIIVLFSLNLKYNDTNSDDFLNTYAEEFYTYEADPYETALLVEFETIKFISNDRMNQVEINDNFEFYLDPYETENLNTNNYEDNDD